jgi:hypothetical protein
MSVSIAPTHINRRTILDVMKASLEDKQATDARSAGRRGTSDHLECALVI